MKKGSKQTTSTTSRNNVTKSDTTPSIEKKPWRRRAPLEIDAIAANLRYAWKNDKRVREEKLENELDRISDQTLTLVFDDYVESLEEVGVDVEFMRQRYTRTPE